MKTSVYHKPKICSKLNKIMVPLFIQHFQVVVQDVTQYFSIFHLVDFLLFISECGDDQLQDLKSCLFLQNCKYACSRNMREYKEMAIIIWRKSFPNICKDILLHRIKVQTPLTREVVGNA